MPQLTLLEQLSLTQIPSSAEGASTVDSITALDRSLTMAIRETPTPQIRSAAKTSLTALIWGMVTGFVPVPTTTPSTLKTCAPSTLATVVPAEPLTSPKQEKKLPLELQISPSESPAHS